MGKMSGIQVREYQSGDSRKIYSLFNEHTPYLRDDKFWVWINRMLSDERSLIIVAEEKGQIIGHYAVIPKTITVKGVSYSAGFAIHAFIHPDYRNGFLIFQITKKMYRVAHDYGLDFIYGFPNENFREIQVKAEKWKEVQLFKALEKTPFSEIETNLTLTQFSDNYTDIYTLSEIIDESQVVSSVIIKKSLNYYLNRYIRHPQSLYENYFITKNKETVAFVCLKKFNNGSESIGHLIDYISTDRIFFEEILAVVENYFYNKVDKISVWKFNDSNQNILLNNNFEMTGFETFLGVKLLIEDKELEKQLTDFKNWQLCMGDSDAF